MKCSRDCRSGSPSSLHCTIQYPKTQFSHLKPEKDLPTLLYHSHFSGSASYGLDVPLWRTSPTPTRRQRCNSSTIYKQVRQKIRSFERRKHVESIHFPCRYFRSFLARSCKPKTFWCLIIILGHWSNMNMYNLWKSVRLQLQWVSLFLPFRLAPSFDGSGRRSAPDVCKRSVARCAKDPSEKVWAELGKDDLIGYPRFDISG